MIAISLLLAGLALGGAPASSQTPKETVRTESRTDEGTVITIETYCSETKLRTTNARIRWAVSPAFFRSNAASADVMSGQTIETTVYKNGFEKGLWVALPLSSQATPERPIAARAQGQLKALNIRAFQLRVVGVEPPAVRRENAGTEEKAMSEETGVVVENLEPGVNYLWRVALDTANGRVVSPTVKTRAPVCPADIVPSPALPRRKP
jgi:hypothetical protein